MKVKRQLENIKNYRQWPFQDILDNVNMHEPEKGQTPLHIAKYLGYSLAVSEILKHNGLILKDKNNQYAWEIKSKDNVTAETNQKIEYQIKEYLYKYRQGYDVSFYNQTYDWLENVNTREKYKCWTPLHRATYHGDLKSIEILLNSGALIMKDSDGKFPHEIDKYFYVSDEDHKKAKALINEVIYKYRRGYDVSFYNQNYNWLNNVNMRESHKSWTPLHRATYHGDHKAIEVLLNHGALVMKDSDNKFPHEINKYLYATKENYDRCIYLIKQSHQGYGTCFYKWPSFNILANPNMREFETGYSWTPLHAAYYLADYLMAKTLLVSGAKIQQDAFGRYPWDIPLYVNANPEEYKKIENIIPSYLRDQIKNSDIKICDLYRQVENSSEKINNLYGKLNNSREVINDLQNRSEARIAEAKQHASDLMRQQLRDNLLREQVRI